MSISKERFESGMSTQEYIDYIKVNKDPFVEIYNTVKLPSNATEWANSLVNPINLAVFTADWCGDAVSTTPIILRLADSGTDCVDIWLALRQPIPLRDILGDMEGVAEVSHGPGQILAPAGEASNLTVTLGAY